MNKRVGVIIIALVMIVGLMAGCGKKETEVVPYDYDLNEYVKVGEYHDLPFVKQIPDITDEDVDNEINSRLQNAAKVENSTTGIVEDGDTINIAFAGKIDGELFDGGSSESYDLTVGTTPMIDGFVEGLVGKNIGETVILDLKFPDEYHSADVAGKPVVFEVTINSKKTTTVPEFNDEFVKENSEFETTEEYKANVKEVLTEQTQEQLDAAVKDALWQIILNDSEVIQYPESELATANGVADSMEADYKNQATLYGMDWKTFLSVLMQTDEEGFAQMKEDYARSMVLSNMVLYKMSRDENVSVSQSEFEQKAKDILATSSFTEESFATSYGMSIFEYAEANGWKESFLLEKLMDKVLEYGHEVSMEEFETYVNESLGYDEESFEEIVESEDTESEADSEGDESAAGESESGSNGN